MEILRKFNDLGVTTILFCSSLFRDWFRINGKDN